jgi:hypothetical protein
VAAIETESAMEGLQTALDYQLVTSCIVTMFHVPVVDRSPFQAFGLIEAFWGISNSANSDGSGQLGLLNQKQRGADGPANKLFL